MKQQPSAIAMTSLSGHSGGTTATITNIVRRKSNPRQQRTTAQSEARVILAYLSQLWGSLTDAQQDAWIAAAPNKIKVKHGVSETLKGNTYFIEVNRNIITAGGDVILLPVAPVAIPNFPFFSWFGTDFNQDESETEFDLGWNAPYQDLPTDPWIPVVYWTKWHKPGVNSLGNPSIITPKQFQTNTEKQVQFTWDSTGAGGPVPQYEFQKTNIKIVFINKNTGQRWEPFSERITATTNSSLTQPIQTGTDVDTEGTTGTPPNLTVTAHLIAGGDEYDFTTYSPVWYMTQWVDPGDADSTPVNILIPNTAITLVDSTHITLVFGPSAGQATHPTVTGKTTTVQVGWRNNTTGEFFWDGGFSVNS